MSDHHNAQARTVREALTAWGWQDLIASTDAWTLDHVYVGDGFPRPVTDKGHLFVVCGGDVLFKLPSDSNRIRGSIYVVRDDAEGQEWEAEQRRNSEANNRHLNPTRMRPRTVLRVVVAG